MDIDFLAVSIQFGVIVRGIYFSVQSRLLALSVDRPDLQ